MTATIMALSDRLLGLVVPKATAQARSCSWVWCYCSGIWGVYRNCCYSGGNYTCGPCVPKNKYEC
ncbi:hypothetical protein [Virgisporangium aurantiacum]|uniref:Uncharacterized protein n=1 Tax=Virgisporangium aurantiacum TaxID=175570 RepID=A0A8J4DZX4_9ACTN|nr:hypothetical protein [Virgisporangium aurantiacum]GIJ57175.1 hypothetical protein Vau01_046910 [Virgisporangium aurantiacum]